MTKKLSYINTTPKRKNSSYKEQGDTSYYRPLGTPVSSVGGLTMAEVLGQILPLVAENYADAVTQLYRGSLLTNPAFANDAEGWMLSGMAEVKVSDAKNNMFLQQGALLLQKNEYIRKPGKHLLYNQEKEEEDLEPSGETVKARASDILVTEPPQWEKIEQPVQIEGTEEKYNKVYLEIKFVCHESGTLKVGLSGSDESSEEAFKSQDVVVEESEEIQEMHASGTWDGNGDFELSFLDGKVEIISLLLVDKPLQEFREETGTFTGQTLQNLTILFDNLKALIAQIGKIQSEIEILYNNDAILEGLIRILEESVETINETLEKHAERLTAVEEKANTAYELALDNRYDIYYELRPNITALQNTVSGHRNELDALSTSVAGALSSISGLQNTVSGHRNELDALSTSVTGALSSISGLQDSVGTLFSSVSKLEKRVLKLEKASSST